MDEHMMSHIAMSHSPYEARKRMEQIRNMQQEEEEDPDEEPEFEEIPDLDDEDLTDTINNRKETTEEQL